jgi:hypothetical protein
VANWSTPHVSDGEMDPGGLLRRSFCVDERRFAARWKAGARRMKRARLLWRREEGQTMAEYGVVLAVISIAWLIALAALRWRL